MSESNHDSSVDVSFHAATAVLRLAAEKLNAFSENLIADLNRAVCAVSDRDDLRCVIITGAGRAFSVGARLDRLRSMSPVEQSAFNGRLVDAFNRIAGLAVPTIAAVNGFVFGGGLELALACTFRIASSEATLGLPEARLGILPGAGGTQRLPRLIGRGPALRLLFTGDTVTAEQAHQLGLVDDVADDPLAAAIALAEEFARSGPCAVRAINEVVRECANLPVTEAIERTCAALTDLLATRDAAEGLAAFAENRQPSWSNR